MNSVGRRTQFRVARRRPMRGPGGSPSTRASAIRIPNGICKRAGAQATVAAEMGDQYPIRLVVHEDLHRSRLTVFFRLLLAIPHLVWLLLWTIAALVVLVVDWFATLIAGRSPAALHNFLARYLRYST